MQSRIYIKTNFDLCTGCSLCQLACSERLFGGYNPHLSVLRIDHRVENLYHFPTVCNQCANPYCANVCPAGAVARNQETGAMVVDSDKCVACGLCGRYCPIDMIRTDPETGKSIKCDLCLGDPQCAAACPTGALEVIRINPEPSDV